MTEMTPEEIEGDEQSEPADRQDERPVRKTEAKSNRESRRNDADDREDDGDGKDRDKKPGKKEKSDDVEDDKEGKSNKKSGDDEDNSDGDGEDKEKGGDEKKPKKPPFYKRLIPMLILSAVVLVAIIVGVLYWLHARQFEATDDAFIDVHYVTISPNVAATVAAVRVDDNQRVKKGDLLVELDPRDYQVIVDQMTANLLGARERVSEAQVQLNVAKANIAEADAEVAVAQANADNAQRDYQRFVSLNPLSRSQEQVDNATASTKTATASVAQAKAKLAASQASEKDSEMAIRIQQAAEKTAEANVRQAQINLGYCTITSPIDGMVTRKNVEAGDYVDKAQPLFSVVPTQVWVTANYKEEQLDLMRVGQDVSITVDAYSGKEFHGKVDSIQNGTGGVFTLLPPENATGNYVKIVQRVPVKIVFNPGELDHADVLLAPGMSVESKVKVR